MYVFLRRRSIVPGVLRFFPARVAVLAGMVWWCSLGDVGELQLALGLGVAVRTEELKAQPERLEELLVSMEETNVVAQAKEAMQQLPRSLMLGLSQVGIERRPKSY